MSKVVISKVFQSEKETKFGPKVSVGIKIDETKVTDVNGEDVEVGDRFINGWFPKGYVFPFQEGDEINILVTERGEYLDFKIPEGTTSGDNSITSRVLRLEKQMKELSGGGAKEETKEEEPTMVPETPEAIDPNDF